MLIVMEPGAGDPAPLSFWGCGMSLGLEFAEFVVSGAAVGLAAVNQVWCAGRARPWTGASGARREAALRRRRGAGRLMAAAQLLNLVLGGAATVDWADDSIRGTQTAAHPPLLWPLVLLAAGAAVSIAVNTVQHLHRPQRARGRQRMV